jgi:hypothetical protein
MPVRLNKIWYDSLDELVNEWSEKGYECSFWEYLNLTKNQFVEWVRKRKQEEYDA